MAKVNLSVGIANLRFSENRQVRDTGPPVLLFLERSAYNFRHATVREQYRTHLGAVGTPDFQLI
jgi:hypothetical protein